MSRSHDHNFPSSNLLRATGTRRLRRGAERVDLIVLLLIASTCGCGRKDGVVVVEGAVSYAGKRVLNGDIRFYPIEGTLGSTAGAPIVDGHYEVENKGGVPVGKHQIVIRAFVLEDVGPVLGQTGGGDLLSQTTPVRAAKPSLPVYELEGRRQFIPRNFNAESELIAEVTGEMNPQSIDFDLPAIKK